MKAICLVTLIIIAGRFEIKIPSPQWTPMVIRIAGENELSEKLKGLLSFTGLFDFSVTKIPDFILSMKKKDEEVLAVLKEISGKVVMDKSYEFISKEYVAREIADDVIEKTTGMKGYFRSVIYFVSDKEGHKELYSRELLAEKSEKITAFNSIVITPRSAPDCSWVSFTAVVNGIWNIYLYENGKITLFLDTPLMKSGLSFSLKRDFAVYSAFPQDGMDSEIYLMDFPSKSVRRLTHGGGIDVSPAFAPDGKRIAFVSERSGHPQIYIMDIEDGSLKRISFGGVYCVSPSWSWDGKWIVYSCMERDNRMKLYISSSDGENMRKLTEGYGNDESPYFYPGSDFIVFTSNRDGDYDIYITDVRGSFLKRIADTPYNEYEVAWCVREKH